MPLDIATNVQNQSKLIASFDHWSKFHIQVRDASTIYLSTNRKNLEVLGPGATQGGLAITQTSGIVSLEWLGDLYVFGNQVQCLYDFETFEDVAPGESRKAVKVQCPDCQHVFAL